MKLSEWQKMRLGTVHLNKKDYGHGREDVTIIAYHFFNLQGYDEAFKRIECAIRETWLHCGMMKTVVITNQATEYLRSFASRFSAVSIQIEESLVPGRIFTMSADMNAKLYSRFDTPYCLIVQNDGFPLRSGLDEFIGKFDFIGAPYIRNIWWKQLIAKALNYHVQNGGLSLRTKKICAQAAYYWNSKYSELGDFPDSSEDMFYTKFLPLKERAYRNSMKFPSFKDSIKFAYDATVPIATPEDLPFGFHNDSSFDRLFPLISNRIDD